MFVSGIVGEHKESDTEIRLTSLEVSRTTPSLWLLGLHWLCQGDTATLGPLFLFLGACRFLRFRWHFRPVEWTYHCYSQQLVSFSMNGGISYIQKVVLQKECIIVWSHRKGNQNCGRGSFHFSEWIRVGCRSLWSSQWMNSRSVDTYYSASGAAVVERQH